MSKKGLLDLDYSKYDFKDPESYIFKSEKGLSRRTVEDISERKAEPEWMKKFRIRSYEHFMKRAMPTWGGDLNQIDFQDIYYYLKTTEGVGKTWEEVPDKIKKTFDRLGIPEAEKKFLAGVGAQYESEVVYHSLLKHLEDKGVIFCDTDTALKLHPEIFRKHFGTVIPPEDNKLAALNSAVWSGGSFIYIPEGVKVELPLQAYFRINAANMGQFERTLIIAEPYSEVNYIEGGNARHQDTGAKVVHLAPYTSSRITSKSVSKDGGRTTYRGLVHVAKGAVGVKSSVRCDALLMDERSRTDTYPYMEVNEDDATITHEASVGRINEDQLFYLMSRGLSETQALSLIVTGFMEPFTRTLPMEYAVEFNRLIEMEMEGAVG